MRKKLLTVALAGVMTLAMSVSVFAESLTGTAWWVGMQAGTNSTVTGDGEITFTVEVKADVDGYAAFSAEIFNPGTGTPNGYYMTSGSDGNVWFGELAGDGASTSKNPFADNGGAPAGAVEVGHTYEVTITRSGKDFTMVYYDVTEDKTLYEMAGTSGCDFPEELSAHIMAQVGTFEVSVKEAGEEPTTEEGATTTAGGEGTTTTRASQTGDNTASTVALLGLAAVGATFVVLASKKSKVTE